MAANTNAEAGDFGFQIAPMVDVVFVLLLFFMACAGLSQKERFLTVPLATGPSSGSPAPIILDIDATGTVLMNGTVLGDHTSDAKLARLREFLTAAMRSAPEDAVIIRPSMDTRHEHVIAVVDICRSLRIKKVSFV